MLCVEPGQLDLHTFDRCVEQARVAGRLRDVADGLRAGLAVWRGPALGGASGMLMAAEAARLEERRLAVLEERIEADLTLGNHAELVAELTALVAEQPLRERVRGQLMVALYRAGRQAEALAVYHQGRRALVEELGLDPGPELQALERRILTGDPGLLLAPAAPAGVIQHPPAVPASAAPPLDVTDRVTSAQRGAQTGQLDPALLWTKLQPPVGRKVISRDALVEPLCTGEPRKLTLIRAPAGWGKTTLLADWHACEYWMNAMAHITQAKVLQHLGRLADAEGAVVRGLELAERGSVPMDLAYGLMILAQVRHDLGDRDGTRELLYRARDAVAGCPDPGLLPALVDSVTRRLLAIPGHDSQEYPRPHSAG